MTDTVSNVDPPAATEAGLAAPVPVGLVDPLQAFVGVALFLALATAAVKSAALSSVSVHPPPARKTALALLGAGARPVPSKVLAVAP